MSDELGEELSDDMKVDDALVVSMDYTLHVEGKVMDTSEGHEPLEFIQGQGHIIAGLESALYGMAIGESKSVVVSAKEGYGEVDPEAFMDVPRAEFPPDVPLTVGTELELRDKGEHPVYARIATVSDDNVRLDMNHPLAGKELHFDVTIAALRPATAEEVAHGHVHAAGHDH
jgi:FKBP-type peptidyl-prolyl cis-trans isomerase SlyD